MIAVCPLTTAGAPAEEEKEPAIAHIPKPTAPTPANSFNPLVIMACAPKKKRRRLHDRLPTIAGRASTGHAHAFTSSCFVYGNQVIFGIVGFNTRCFVFKMRRAEFFVIRTYRKFATQSLIEFTNRNVAPAMSGPEFMIVMRGQGNLVPFIFIIAFP